MDVAISPTCASWPTGRHLSLRRQRSDPRQMAARTRLPPSETAPFAPAVMKQIRACLAAADLMPDTCLPSLLDAMWLVQVNFLNFNKAAVVGHRSARYAQRFVSVHIIP